MKMNLVFPNEQTLVTSFLSRLVAGGSPWGQVQVAAEFFYNRGRTDIVACTGNDSLIAIEAKLVDWRTALQQAFRNRCFAHLSYVLLPKNVAVRAHAFAGEFNRRRVGICYLEHEAIVMLHPSAESEPIEPWLSQRAILHIAEAGASA